jgi:hypothetical protein
VRALLILLGVIAVHRTANAQPAKARECHPAVIDSSLYNAATIKRDCDVDVPAKVKREAKPEFKFPQELRCAIVEFTVVVDSTGAFLPGSVALVSANDADYGALIIKSVPTWRFEAAKLGGKPASQLLFVRHARADGRVPFVVSRDRTPPPPPPCV